MKKEFSSLSKLEEALEKRGYRMTKLEEGNRHWRKANGFHAIIRKKKETVELDIHRDPKRGKHKPGRAKHEGQDIQEEIDALLGIIG
ncbi:hypothetical protein AKJ36_00920 [candidate division MSBL1 archaeon SCGC-AAA259I07]|uniref:Uncharacterized protein n=1 Tax=candidate division MSBL1 archaeon SCGC-AAA259I07 TaxID=1698266 RepID=A0A133UMC5_9EURY|nr:hypothetical protein AKJ36_00920 [candidate division MSBL1 archaeon SCGC-AAA259I07]